MEGALPTGQTGVEGNNKKELYEAGPMNKKQSFMVK
jgi:hypothetical protein